MREQYHAIGETAGKIYQALEKNGPAADADLKKVTGISDAALFNHALGWLAREDKINFKKKGKGWQLSLAPESAKVC